MNKTMLDMHLTDHFEYYTATHRYFEKIKFTYNRKYKNDKLNEINNAMS